MNHNEKFPQDELNVSMEIGDEALENVSGGASANIPGVIICTYCGKDDSFVWRGGYRFCTRCSKNHVSR